MNRIAVARVLILTGWLLGACAGEGASHRSNQQLLPGRGPTPTPFLPLEPTFENPALRQTPDPRMTLEAIVSQYRLPYARSQLRPASDAVLKGVNAARTERGLAPLQSSDQLTDFAYLRSEDMIVRDYYGHLDPATGEAVLWTLLADAGYEGRIAENLFAMTGLIDGVPEAVLNAWLDSADHRANLLDPSFRFTGIGLMGDGTWWMIAQIFAEEEP